MPTDLSEVVDTPLGRLRTVSPDHPNYRPWLLVAVHGIRTRRNFFEPLISELECKTQHKFDIMQFEYPAFLYESIDLDIAAEDLLNEIRVYGQGKSHIFFICHSAGGIVFKKALTKIIDAADTIDPSSNEKIIDNPIRADYADSLSFMNYRIVWNHAVPNDGGRYLVTSMACLFSTTIGLLERLYVIRALEYTKIFKGLDRVFSYLKFSPLFPYALGVNKIVCLLRDRIILDEIEDDYVSKIKLCEEKGLPHILIYERMSITDEAIIKNEDESLQRRNFSWGTEIHSGIRDDPRVRESACNQMLEIFDRYATELTNSNNRNLLDRRQISKRIAHASYLWCHHLNSQISEYKDLIGTVPKQAISIQDETDLLLFDKSRIEGSQRYIMSFLRRMSIVSRGISGNMGVIVDAKPGGGKSVLLREYVRYCSIRFLRAPIETGSVAVCVGIPLQVFRLTPQFKALLEDDSASSNDVLDGLARLWAPWANEVMSKLAFSQEIAYVEPFLPNDLITALNGGASIALLDSLDEFMGLNALGLPAVRNLIKALFDTSRSLGPRIIILGARKGTITEDDQYFQGWRRCSIADLTLSEIEEFWPTVKKDMPHFEEKEICELVGRPLFASRLAKFTDRGNIQKIEDVYDRCFCSYFDRTDAAIGDEDMVAIIAWLSTLMSHGGADDRIEFTANELIEKATELSSNRSTPLPINLIDWLDDLCTNGRLDRIIRTTMFLAVGMRNDSQLFRFEHRVLLETALSRFLAYTISSSYFGLISRRTFVPSILLQTGYYLRGEGLVRPRALEFNSSIIEASFAETERERNQFIFGNFSAMLSFWNPKPNDYESVERYFYFLRKLPATGEENDFQTAQTSHVAFSSLIVASFDTSTKENFFRRALKNEIVPGADLTKFNANAITVSLLECIRQISFGDSLKESSATADLFLRDALYLSISVVVKEMDEEKTRSMRNAFVQSFEWAMLEPRRLVTGIHYGLIAAAAVKENPRWAEINENMIRVLDKNGNERWLRHLDVVDRPEGLEAWRPLIGSVDSIDSAETCRRLGLLKERLDCLLNLGRDWVLGDG